ncbi:proton-translocating NADH-quinone oxidoreductase,chain M [Fibrella aestuarina BUZ 2]|uniref:Proton-translocating NADH-quinone oxidoreductase,chain M n=1 Tax=Fibrella aestuarina BUZ 2 TaxID=1166018 RepID=I0K500_9BACT|nr:NADH-quinone oxidoreductase subunit M [Fibrella aestuarina]CCG99203.1 proton-translocating NADH-quinone oxidoreductase,chain M [Fibrella aestuarina BUZ 2]
MLLSLLIFLPIAASLVAALVPERLSLLRWLTVAVLATEVLLAALVYGQFDATNPAHQQLEQADWITLPLGNLGRISIDYLIGIDGISLPLVLLTAIIMLVGAISSWQITKRPNAYFSLYLLLTGTIMGCFVALDFFLFFLFFEFMLLPMYFLIGLWGGPRREYASIKFFLYTLAGSVLILLVMIGLSLSVIDPVSTALAAGLINNPADMTAEVLALIQQQLATGQLDPAQLVHTFDWRYMADGRNYLPNALLSGLNDVLVGNVPVRTWAFWAVFVGFAIKLPIVPVHTWLPDAHVEAPTPVSVVLAGVLLKIGGYGLIRVVWGFFPDAASEYTVVLAGLGALSIVYGGLNALAQYDLKKMIAYSSVSHMGFVLLGVASTTGEGVNGAVYQMVSHGVLSAMLFLLTGVLYDRTHDRRIDSYRGLMTPMPQYATLTAVAFFASLGLPGFSGFVGELFTLMGSYQSAYVPGWITAISTLGIVLAAAYFLWTLQRMFFGPVWVRAHSTEAPANSPHVLADLDPRERLMLVPLGVLALLLGLFPNWVFSLSHAAVAQWLLKFTVD